MLKWSAWPEWLFSIKTYIAAMLALYLAFRLGLPRPFWTLTASFSVALPVAGAVRSKAVYRALGTFVGAIFTVFVLSKFIQYPLLLSLVTAFWVATCVYFAQLDRSPRSYIFILSGYTTSIIIFPALVAPETLATATLYDLSSARVQETLISIICATVVHSVIFPQNMGPALLARLRRIFLDTRAWMAHILSYRGGAVTEPVDFRHLAQEITYLRLNHTLMPFDTTHLRWVTDVMLKFQDRLAEALPVLSAMQDRLEALYKESSLPPEWDALLKDIQAWLENDQSAQQATVLRRRIKKLTPAIHPQSGWQDLLLLNLADDLIQLLTILDKGFYLRYQIIQGMQGKKPRDTRRMSSTSIFTLHTDKRMMFVSSLAVFISISLCCALWYFSSWPMGFCAPLMASISSSLFVVQDNPIPTMKVFLRFTFFSSISAGIYLFYFFPAINNYEIFLLAMAPFLLICGYYMARPATFLPAMALMMGTGATFAIKDMGMYDIPAFFNSQLSQVLGIIVVLVIYRLMRVVSADWMVDRLLAAGRKELARLCEAVRIPSIHVMTSRMVDRISLLTPRLATSDTQSPALARLALDNLRTSLSISQLVRLKKRLARHGIVLDSFLAQLSTYFRTPPDELETTMPLQTSLDHQLAAICALPASSMQKKALAALTGIRCDLFPETPAPNLRTSS